MWMTWAQGAAAIYLVGMAVTLDPSKNWPSRLLFKLAPMAIGLPLAFGVAGKILGWPI